MPREKKSDYETTAICLTKKNQTQLRLVQMTRFCNDPLHQVHSASKDWKAK